MTLMKAVVYDKKHAPYKLRLGELEKPIPSENEVLLKVVSVSLNAADYRSMKMGIIPKKKIFGSAVSGTIESVGKDVRQFKAGDDVVGDLTDFGFGGLAEYVTVSEKAFALKPTNTSFEDVVTIPVATTTALKAMRDKGNIQAGKKVLIVGSSGGVGTSALQLANYFGAKVTAVCSTQNIEQSTSLGADKVIDYTKSDFTKGTERYDLILAINGNYPLLAYKRILNPKGTYVMVGGKLSQVLKSIFFGWLFSYGGKTMKALSAKADQEDLAYLTKLLDEGEFTAIIHKRYTLEQAAEAMDDLSTGHCPANVVVNIR